MLTKNSPEVVGFVESIQKIVDDHFQQHFNNLAVPKIELEEGEKFIRVVRVGSQRMVYCFIAKCDNQTKALGSVKEGDILKAASYKIPAKHARGSLFDNNKGLCDVNPYGVRYLR